MNRISVLVFVALSVAACGGNDSPLAPGQNTLPAVVYPNMVGSWNGTLTISVAVSGATASNVCTESWIITTQTQGTFTGTFQLSGGTTTSCGSAGTISGIVSTSGAITNLTPSTTLGATGCVRIGGTGIYSGVLTGTTLSAQTTDTLRCGNLDGNRSLTINVQKS